MATKQETITTETPPLAAYGSTVLGIPIILTAIRCTLQYIIVPLVVPLLGWGDTFSPLVNIGAGALAIGVIGYNLVTLWNTNWRKRYLLIAAIFVPFILISAYFDFVKYAGL